MSFICSFWLQQYYTRRNNKLLEVIDISKKYKNKDILKNISLNINKQDIVALIGKNGAGKSTLLSIITGFLKPDGNGKVLWDTRDVFNEKLISAKIGFVSQEDTLFNDLTVKDNLEFWRITNSATKEKLNYFINLLELSDFLDKKIKYLSGGMRRRVMICSCLIHEPELIVLDEPFSGIDLYYKSQLISYLKTLQSMGKTIIYSSHNGDELTNFSNKIIVITNYDKVICKPISEVLSSELSVNETLLQLISNNS